MTTEAKTTYDVRDPHRLVFMMIGYCDYTDKITPSPTDSYDKSCFVVTHPNDHLLGIQCRSDLISYGRRDMYIYCVENKIYPTHDLTGFDRRNIKVKRTNGDIETDWRLLDEATEILSELDKDIVMVHVAKNDNNINKWIELTEFCSLNDIDYKNLQKQLIANLEKCYEVDFSSDIWKTVKTIPNHSFDV